MMRMEKTKSLALSGLALGTLLTSLGSSVANIALPTLAGSFGTTFKTVQWVVLAYLMAMTGAMPFAGRLGDQFGRRRLLLGGLALFTAASVVGSVAPGLGLLVAARAIQGVGAALVTALGLAFVAEVVPREHTGRAMGLLGTTSAVGTALGPSLGGVLVQLFGWRSIFAVAAPLGVIAIGIARSSLPASAPSARAEGGVLRHLRDTFAPLFDPNLRPGLIGNLLVSIVMMATLVVGPFHLSHTWKLDAAVIGAVMSIGPVAAALMGIPAGSLVDRLGARSMIFVGLLGVATGAALLALLPDSVGVLGYIASIVMMTTSYALFQAANNTAILRDLEPERRGTVSGALNLSRNLGLIGGTSLMGGAFAAAGLHATFALGSGLVFVALLTTFASAVRRPAWRWWTAPVLLIALSAVPAIFGTIRLIRMSSGAAATPEDARFLAAPVPVIAHILAAMLFSLIGAFQFPAEARRRWPRAHRIGGRAVLVAGIVVGVSGLWMTAFYELPAALQGPLLYAVRVLVGLGMLASLWTAFRAIRRGDIARHRAWMIRAYALGLGAGTQAVLMLPWSLAFGLPTHLPYELLMTLAWLINLAVAERLIRTRRGRRHGTLSTDLSIRPVPSVA